MLTILSSLWIEFEYVMSISKQLNPLVKSAREAAPKRNFKQSVELTLVLKDIDVKKGFNFMKKLA